MSRAPKIWCHSLAMALLLTLLGAAFAASPINWTETTGIQWCSDGKSPDWVPKSADPFGAGVDGGCARTPPTWTLEKVVAACETLCAPVDAVPGFTLYPGAHQGGPPTRNLTECCFRTGGVGQKPTCSAAACKGTRCYQKKPDPPPPPPPPPSNITVAVGRRPYIFEQTGHLLVRSATASAGTCTVAAKLVGSAAVLSNGSWTLTLGTDTVASFPFSLSPLPASIYDEVQITIDCPSIGWKTQRFRSFQRAPAAGAPARSVTQVDALTRTMRVGGEPFLSVGWYYSIFDNGGRNLTEFVAQQAQAGVNTLLLYTFPLMMLHGKADLQREVLDACDAVGMKVWMDLAIFVPKLALNSTQDWADFTAVVKNVRDHPATLGYYLCDDCWGHNPALQAKVYRAIKLLDPYHVTAGAGGTSAAFSDGESAGGHLRLSLDVPLLENYNEVLSTRISPSSMENSGRDFPNYWTAFVNCPWSESSNQMGLGEYHVGHTSAGAPQVYSAHRMRTTAYAGLVGDAGIANLVFFDYFTNTEDRLLHGVERIAQEMQDLKPSLLAPLTTPQPSISVATAGLRARAWSEDVRGSTTVCIHAIVLNSLNAFQPVNATLTFAGLPESIKASLPFEGDADREVGVSSGTIHDMIAPNDVNVYRIGCTVPPPEKTNLSPNPGFELPSLMGGVTGWSGGRAGWANDDHHDLRARMVLDTTNPHQGRYSLRITVPTAAPLVQPWAEECAPECNAGSDGFLLVPHTSFRISVWARCDSAAGTMRLELLTGHWAQDPVEAAAFHTVGAYVANQSLVASTVNASWQRVSASVSAAGVSHRPITPGGIDSPGRFLQLRLSGGPGMMFLDNAFIGANVTEDD